MSLAYISEQITIYGSLCVAIAGIIGNSINILVFSSVRSYRITPCTFYFLVASVFNITYVTMFPISRIVMVGYGIDLTKIYVSWCKIRPFCGSVLALTSLSCTCLATIDQFFATSQNASLRRLSNIKWAKRVVFIIIIVWILHGIPILLFYNISSTTRACGIIHPIYSIYFPIYLITLLGAVPVLVMLIFGYLAYRNIHQTRVLAQQQADRQLTKMTLVQVALVFFPFVPFGSNNAYTVITASIKKDTDRIIQEALATNVFSTICYIYFIGSCYMFLMSSSRFRRATKDRILLRFRSTQVVPTQIRTVKSIITEKKTRISVKPM